jgi:hypothetical protein
MGKIIPKLGILLLSPLLASGMLNSEPVFRVTTGPLGSTKLITSLGSISLPPSAASLYVCAYTTPTPVSDGTEVAVVCADRSVIGRFVSVKVVCGKNSEQMDETLHFTSRFPYLYRVFVRLECKI